MSNPIDRAAEALGRRFTLIQPHARDIAQALDAAGLLVSEQEAQGRERAAAVKALRQAADYFAGGLHCADMRATPEETVRDLRRRADRLAQQDHEQEGRR